MPYSLHHGDCLEVLRSLPDCSVDAVVTDPPYGLTANKKGGSGVSSVNLDNPYGRARIGTGNGAGGFMGLKWDSDVPSEEVWRECLRVLKPGGHLLAFAGTRTQHRMAVRIEDAGFEIRDMIAWVYGSGFPKSLDVSKAIAKRAGGDLVARDAVAFMRARREELGLSRVEFERLIFGRSDGNVRNWEDGISIPKPGLWEAIKRAMALDVTPFDSAMARGDEEIGRMEGSYGYQQGGDRWESERILRAPATDAARQWQGWGTALKPSYETVTWATKPLTAAQERDIILSNQIRLEARLWLLSSASAAEKSSTLSQSEYGAACAIAQWSADEITSTRADLCAQMDMSRFELAANTSLSIVSSWRRTLAESWNGGNTSTIETRSSTIIDWRTLKFSLSQITPESIIKACSLPGGFSANASTAESHFNASLSLLQSIRTLSATEPAISQAQQEHLGAGVKPNLDPCIMARKPLIGTVSENVLAHGTGAINVDGCRVGEREKRILNRSGSIGYGGSEPQGMVEDGGCGRWPANLIHDGSEEVARLMTGGEARFFYTAKASKDDRDEGLEGFEKHIINVTEGHGRGAINTSKGGDGLRENYPRANVHPTVKPTDLMRYLCRLVTPPGGTVLDPFMGSGSTGKAAILEGFSFIGIERESEYVEIARARIDAVTNQPKQQALF